MISRDLIKTLKKLPAGNAQAIVVFGARRVGKTTLFRNLASNGKVLWFNGDSKEDAEIIAFNSTAEDELPPTYVCGFLGTCSQF